MILVCRPPPGVGTCSPPYTGPATVDYVHTVNAMDTVNANANAMDGTPGGIGPGPTTADSLNSFDGTTGGMVNVSFRSSSAATPEDERA